MELLRGGGRAWGRGYIQTARAVQSTRRLANKPHLLYRMAVLPMTCPGPVASLSRKVSQLQRTLAMDASILRPDLQASSLYLLRDKAYEQITTLFTVYMQPSQVQCCRVASVRLACCSRDLCRPQNEVFSSGFLIQQTPIPHCGGSAVHNLGRCGYEL